METLVFTLCAMVGFKSAYETSMKADGVALSAPCTKKRRSQGKIPNYTKGELEPTLAWLQGV